MSAQKDDVLVGNDGTVEQVTLGEELVGDGTKTLVELGLTASKTFVYISAMAPTNSFFATGMVTGDIYPVSGTEVLSVGDKVKKMTFTPLLDLVGWSFTFSSDWIEVSVLRDKVKKYRKGKSDVDGSIKFAVKAGYTSRTGGNLNQFMKIVEREDESVTVSEINDAPLYIRGVVNNDKSAGETFEFIWARISLGGISLGADDGARQEYDASMRIVGNDPVYYTETIAA